MKLSWLVPFRPDGPAREAAWTWVRRRIEASGAELVVGTDPGEPFSKAVAFHDAYRRATGDLLILADADVAVHSLQLADAVAMVEAGAPWAYPYTRVVRLTRRATSLLLSGDWLGAYGPEDAEEVRQGSPGGIMVLPRDAWDTVGGPDRRFRGWGGEDVALRAALDTLWGPHVRVPGDLVHLWHPSTMRGGRRAWPAESRARNRPLMEHYQSATGSPAYMRAVISEAGR